MKKLLSVGLMTTLMGANAFALTYAINVDVVSVSSDTNGAHVAVYNGSTTFEKTVLEANRKEMVAMALTAMTAGKKITLIIDGATIQKMKLLP